jgi:hypothetical protein
VSFAECPFAECPWSTVDPVHVVEADAVEGGWDRLALHLRVEHGARPAPDTEAWNDGSWQGALFGARWDWEAGDWK